MSAIIKGDGQTWHLVGAAYVETPIKHVLMMSSGIDFYHFQGSPIRNHMYWDIMQAGHDFDAWAAVMRTLAHPATFNDQ
ncbi:MAG: hypothetical protein ACR2PZ_10615 [Pseudomonadales bacterium]